MKLLIQKLKYTFVAFTIISGFSMAFLPSNVFAAPPKSLFSGAKKEACAGTQLTPDSGPNCSGDDKTALSETIKAVINLISVIVGIIAVIMIIIGGIRFIISSGDSSKVTSARNTIIYALIGLILVAFAQIIVKFVLSRI